jgi:hypothetical protein
LIARPFFVAGFRLDPMFFAVRQDQKTTLCAGMFERESHQGFDQSAENDFTGDGLRGLDHRVNGKFKSHLRHTKDADHSLVALLFDEFS